MADVYLIHDVPREVVRPSCEPALTRWLETQARVVELWIERLIGEGGDPKKIAVLQQHAAFLREAGEF